MRFGGYVKKWSLACDSRSLLVLGSSVAVLSIGCGLGAYLGLIVMKGWWVSDIGTGVERGY